MTEIDTYITGFERHLRVLHALSDTSVKIYRREVCKFFGWLKDKNKVEEVTRQDIEAYLEKCFYAGNVNQTRFTKLIGLKKFFRYLVYEGVISSDVTELIPRPRISKKFVQKFSKAEVLSMFRAVNITTEKGLRDIVILILAAFCGFRVSEIINLRISDILDDGKSLDINVVEAKRDSFRVVYLWKAPSMFVRQLLAIRLAQGAQAGDPLIVPYWKSGRVREGDGRRIAVATLNMLVWKYAQLAKVHKARAYPHMFRATHASDLRSIRGYDIAAIAQRLGHKHISSTDRYLPSRDRIQREYRSLADYWSEFTTLWNQKEKETSDGQKATETEKTGAYL